MWAGCPLWVADWRFCWGQGERSEDRLGPWGAPWACRAIRLMEDTIAWGGPAWVVSWVYSETLGDTVSPSDSGNHGTFQGLGSATNLWGMVLPAILGINVAFKL